MLCTQLFVAFIVSLLPVAIFGSSTTQQYCATITSDEASGAYGYVALEVSEGVATYSFSLNLANFVTSTACDYDTYGLKYHIHSYWDGETTTSAANTLCSAANTGGHYDPNFACSNSSQSAATSCVELERIYIDGYRYNCTSTNYKLGLYSNCEVGDVSGKNGKVFPNSDSEYSVSGFTDYQPPYIKNYNFADVTSLPWNSFVFHCAQNDARLVCAQFSTTDLTACEGAFPSSSNNDDDNDSYSEGDIIAAVIVPSVGFLLIGLLAGFYFGKSKGAGLASNQS